jgi:hypothetical protein
MVTNSYLLAALLLLSTDSRLLSTFLLSSGASFIKKRITTSLAPHRIGFVVCVLRTQKKGDEETSQAQQAYYL